MEVAQAKRLNMWVNGRLQAADAAAPLLWSDKCCWSGFPLERGVPDNGSAESIVHPFTGIVMVAAGAVRIEYRALGVIKSFVAQSGSLTIWPSGYELTRPVWTQIGAARTELLLVQLDGSTFEKLAPLQSAVIGDRLAQRSGIQDATAASLMRLMESDVTGGCSSGKLYGESLSLALALHVAKQHCNVPIETPPEEGLSRPVLSRVIEFIRTNLAGELTICELAAMANMSPHHFSLRFKASVGLTPHQWVTRTRIREAERLLTVRSMSISEVALSMGFANQSHFTNVFHRWTGTTPKRYQRMR